MAKTKRPHEAETGAMDDVHPSRKKRVKYNDQDAELATIYNDLADEVQEVRIKAAGHLIKNLSTDSPDRDERLNTAETRLIKGLCSGRKAARLGFSIALAELVRLQAQLHAGTGSPADLANIVQLTTPQGNVSGQERRDYLLGRRFAFQAVLQSDIGLDKTFSDDEWTQLIGLIFDLAGEKSWLRRECGSMLYEYLASHITDLNESKKPRVQIIVDIASGRNLWKTPEGVGLWIFIRKNFPNVKLPTGVWNHYDPLSSKERQVLAKALIEDAAGDDTATKKPGSRQSNPSFAWTAIMQDWSHDFKSKKFRKFWEDCVASAMFSSKSSPERRALGLQILSLALSLVPPSDMPSVLHTNIIRCIVDQRSEPDRYLHEAAKRPLNDMVALAKLKPEAASPIVIELITNGAANFDQATKTKTIESIINEATEDALKEIIHAIFDKIQDTTSQANQDAESQRKRLPDLLPAIVRARKTSRESLPETLVDDTDAGSWLLYTLQKLSDLAYRHSLPVASQATMQTRLMSCLKALMDSPLRQAAKAPSLTVWYTIRDIEKLGKDSDATQCLQAAKSCMAQAYKESNTSSYAFSLLFSLGVLEVLNGEAEATTVLQDLVDCYQTRDESSTTMLVELLLSFISKPSKLYRTLAEQVFSGLTGDITAESLQSLTDILAQKESLAGQRELFKEGSDGESVGEDDEDVMDVEDQSDVELVNGEAPSDVDSDDGSDSSEAEDGASEDDEEAVFNKKLADALGTAAVDDESDDDGSDMDDDQMMALEPHLTSIFKERKSHTSKKREKKDAKENIVNFKNRVLDLLNAYVKAQSGSILALDLIVPLLRLIRTTTSKQSAEKAFTVLKQYFESSKKHDLPQPDDHDACFDVLTSIHDEMQKGGSKTHAAACSRSGLFLARVLVALDREYYRRISDMYNDLHKDWVVVGSRVQGSIFTEWMNWSQSIRRLT